MSCSNPRLDKIKQSIEDIRDDAWSEGYHHGHDEGWDEAADTRYDEGWDDCKAYMNKQESYDKTSAYDEGYTEGSNTTYERMKGDPEKDWDTGYEYGLSKGIDEGWNAATAGHTAAKEASYDEGYDTAMTNFEADARVNDLTAEAKRDGWHRGYNVALEDIIEMFPGSGFFQTPTTKEELDKMLDVYKDNGPMSVAITLNFIQHELKGMLDGYNTTS